MFCPTHHNTSFFAFRISHFGHFAFRISDISHFATRNRTLRISRRETGHSGMTKYQTEDGARHSQRVSGAESVWRRSKHVVAAPALQYSLLVPSRTHGLRIRKYWYCTVRGAGLVIFSSRRQQRMLAAMRRHGSRGTGGRGAGRVRELRSIADVRARRPS